MVEKVTFIAAILIIILFSTTVSAFDISESIKAILDGIKSLMNSLLQVKDLSGQKDSLNPPSEFSTTSTLEKGHSTTSTLEKGHSTTSTLEKGQVKPLMDSSAQPDNTQTTTTSLAISIACYESSDCGQKETRLICINGNVYEQHLTPICYNAGKKTSECKLLTSGTHRAGQLLPAKENCGDKICRDGRCVDDGFSTSTTSMTIATTTTLPSATTTLPSATTTTISVTTTTTISLECVHPLYNSQNCAGECIPGCESCNMYPGTPCHICEKNCSLLGAGWSSSVSCDLLHEELVEHQTCSGCYRCDEVCPKDSGYYRHFGCDAKCPTILCRQVGASNPSSPHADCYRCQEPVCGNGIIEPGEQCEHDNDCPEHHFCDPMDCACITDCASYCASSGKNYFHAPNAASRQACEAKMNDAMSALTADCRAVCGAYSWAEGMTDTCCCVSAEWEPCLNCPCTMPCAPDCDTPMPACKAKL